MAAQFPEIQLLPSKNAIPGLLTFGVVVVRYVQMFHSLRNRQRIARRKRA
jgi:hypothetical protein